MHGCMQCSTEQNIVAICNPWPAVGLMALFLHVIINILIINLNNTFMNGLIKWLKLSNHRCIKPAGTRN